MAKDYLPDSYLRKRQRDAKLRQVRDWAMILFIVVAAAVSGYFIYSKLILPKRMSAGVSEQMAEQRQDLTQKQQEQQNAASQPGGQPIAQNNGINAPSMSDTDLSRLDYTSSFPLINVSVETGASGDKREATPAEEQKPEDEKPEVKPEEEKTEEKPKTEDKPKAEEKPQEKPKEEPAVKPEEKPQEKPEEKPAEPASEPKVLYKVYAGSHYSREDAEQQVKDLNAIGLNGSIIEKQPNFLVLVGTFSGVEEASALRDRLKSSGFSAFASETRR